MYQQMYLCTLYYIKYTNVIRTYYCIIYTYVPLYGDKDSCDKNYFVWIGAGVDIATHRFTYLCLSSSQIDKI